MKELETDSDGKLVIPPSVLGTPGPHVRYRVRRKGSEIRIIPSEQADPKNLSPKDRAKEFSEWIKKLPRVRHLADEALRRENFYD